MLNDMSEPDAFQIDKRLILDAILELEDIDDNTPFTEMEKSITPQEFSTFVRAE